MRKLKCGVVGVGHLGQHHVRIYKEMREASLVGIYDTNVPRAQEIARTYGTRAYASLGSLIRDAEAISLAVPTTVHYETALEIIRQGRHVLVEKPITSTVAQGQELLRAAHEKGVVLCVGHTERFAPPMIASRQWVARPKFIEALRLAGFAARGTDVSVIHDLMIHDIDLVLSIVDSNIERVEAIGVPVFTPSVDIANARLCFRDGTIASLTASRVSAERLRKVRFFQEDAYISVDFLKRDVKIYRRKHAPDRVTAAPAGALAMQDLVEVVMPPVDDEEPLVLEIEDFIASVQGRKRPEVPGEAGVKALEVASEIVKDIEARLTMWRS